MTLDEQPHPSRGHPASDPKPRVLHLHAVDPPQPDLSLKVPATAAEVAGIRKAVVASAEAHGAGPESLADIALAVTEACTNVVLHAYVGTLEPGPLTVEFHRDGGEFVVTVSDNGPGIAPRADSPGLGVGLALISGMTQRLQITNQAPGARVTMTFVITVP